MTKPRILVVDDEDDIRLLIREILEEEGYDVSLAGSAEEARELRSRHVFELVLLDIWMPDTDGISLLTEWNRTAPLPTVMISGHGSVEAAMEASRLGAIDFLEKPISIAKLLQTVERSLQKPLHKVTGSPISTGLELVGKSALIQHLRQQLQLLSPIHSPVLFIGEPGSGRENCARWLHQLRGQHGAFVRLPFDLQDWKSTEANIWVEEAREGTLFIPEVTGLTAHGQESLLALLNHLERIPERRPDLMASAQPHVRDTDNLRINRVLYDTLAVMLIEVPPVREYREDIPELLKQTVNWLVDARQRPYRRFSIAAQNRLRHYDWPGNRSQLQNVVEQLLVTGDDDEISQEEVEQRLAREVNSSALGWMGTDWLELPLREARERFERHYFQEQLKLCEGRIGRLAEKVGMERTHLYRKLRHLGIDPTRSSEEPESGAPAGPERSAP
jgi:DNA-binding NtrC family response regulator